MIGPSGIQTYRYTAFGERQTSSSLDCPWGFNNKRLDSDTGYLRFPKRDYCPDLGRWLTPDPLNFDDGPNLYAYVKNNPLMFEDPYGLFMTSTFNPSYKQGFSTSFQRGFFNPYETMKQPTSLPFKIAANDHDAVSNHLMDRSLQIGEYTGAMAGVATGLALNYGIGKAGYSLAGKLAKPFFSGFSKVFPNIGRGINGEMAGGIGKQGVPLSRGAENVNAGVNLSNKLSQLEKAQNFAVRTKTLPDGRIRYYKQERPSLTSGPTRGSSYVIEHNPANGNVRGWNECYDHMGNINRVHPKNINGQDIISSHYPPTARDLGL